MGPQLAAAWAEISSLRQQATQSAEAAAAAEQVCAQQRRMSHRAQLSSNRIRSSQTPFIPIIVLYCAVLTTFQTLTLLKRVLDTNMHACPSRSHVQARAVAEAAQQEAAEQLTAADREQELLEGQLEQLTASLQHECSRKSALETQLQQYEQVPPRRPTPPCPARPVTHWHASATDGFGIAVK